jgi:hypothetical protein
MFLIYDNDTLKYAAQTRMKVDESWQSRSLAKKLESLPTKVCIQVLARSDLESSGQKQYFPNKHIFPRHHYRTLGMHLTYIMHKL